MSNSMGRKELQSDFYLYKYSSSPLQKLYANNFTQYMYHSDVSAGMPSAHKEYKNHGNTAFYNHKIHIAKSLYILKKKSLVSLVLHRLGLCLQFSPLFSRHMSFFCQIKFTFRQLASIENALITSINSNLGVNQFLHA